MSRFHFHVHNAVDAMDDEGREMDDLVAARLSAMESVRCLMSDEIRLGGRTCLSYSITIANPEGVELHTVRYGDGVAIEP